jgi:hypothetical protein
VFTGAQAHYGIIYKQQRNIHTQNHAQTNIVSQSNMPQNKESWKHIRDDHNYRKSELRVDFCVQVVNQHQSLSQGYSNTNEVRRKVAAGFFFTLPGSSLQPEENV